MKESTILDIYRLIGKWQGAAKFAAIKAEAWPDSDKGRWIANSNTLEDCAKELEMLIKAKESK